MSFETHFRASSYAMIACGALALALSGGMGAGLLALFGVVLVVSWRLEGTKWRLPERWSLGLLLLAVPLFFLDWKFQGGIFGDERGGAGIASLVHFTLFLSSVKLLQAKADRDWLFLYLISFFEVLLSAGLSVSPFFLASLALYMFCALLTVVCFEMRKARRAVPHRETRLLVSHDGKKVTRLAARRARRKSGEVRRLPVAAFGLLVLIFTLALPIFFITPRFNNKPLVQTGGGATGFVGFSDEVTLGDIGRLQQSEQLVMRVRVEEPQAGSNRGLRWRGVALDYFTGRGWRRSSDANEIVPGSERSLFQLGTTAGLERLTTQTFFIEPIDTPVLFVAPRAVALQGALPYVRRDSQGSLTSRMHPQERVTYRAYSDTIEPPVETLRADRSAYPRIATPNLRLPVDRYLQLPATLDTRIASLAWLVINQSGARNRYDAARAIEAHLNRNEYGGDYRYSLDMLAKGQDPLADFLFNVRAGHCEYFATAMAVMLRSQGIPARVVNGFQTGRYNAAADAYTVGQKDAHSWVEVYFPGSDSWVTFDPTPAAGRSAYGDEGSLQASLRNYAEALELFWIQYVVAYDKQEQHSLASSLRSRLSEFRRAFGQSAEGLKASLAAMWRQPSGGEMSGPTALRNYAPMVLVSSVVMMLLFPLLLRVWRSGRWRGLKRRNALGPDESAIEFYERMSKALETRGLKRPPDQTPLEFAASTGMPEVVKITSAYHRVRYGAQQLSVVELAEVENFLNKIEKKDENRR